MITTFHIWTFWVIEYLSSLFGKPTDSHAIEADGGTNKSVESFINEAVSNIQHAAYTQETQIIVKDVVSTLEATPPARVNIKPRDESFNHEAISNIQQSAVLPEKQVIVKDVESSLTTTPPARVNIKPRDESFNNEAISNIQQSAVLPEKQVIVKDVESSLTTTPPARVNLKHGDETDSSKNTQIKRNKYIDFPFLQDETTVFHVMNSHVMFIMRGLSGSGKTTIVNLINETYQNAIVCSADDYFLVDGEYYFDVKGLEYAHRNCQSKALQACERGVRTIVIDNTNVRKWEMNHYFQLASKYGYTAITVLPQTPWRFDADELAKRNKHGVRVDILSAKVDKFDRVNPMYWAWFLNHTDGDRLTSMVDKYFPVCCDRFPQLVARMKSFYSNPDLDVNYYKMYNLKRTFHCTAFYGGRGRNADPEANNYAEKPTVIGAMGKSQVLHIVAINITASTIGAKVGLTDYQLQLWGKDDNESRYRGRETSRSPSGGHLKHGSRAHITVAYAPGTEAVQTGFDQIHLAQLELQNVVPECAEVDDAVIKYYPDGICTVEFKSPLRINTLFSGYY